MMFVLTFLPLYFLLFVYFSIKGVFSVFGKMKPTPILFHAILADKRQAFMKQRFMLRFIPWILLWLGTSALATSYMPKIFHTISLRLDVEYWVFNLAGFAFFDLVLVLLINKEVGLKNLLSDRKKYTKWFAVNYAEPNVLEMSSVLKTSPERRNLVILQLESMESGFSSAELFEENLLSPLQKWMARGVSFSNYVKCPGGYFTIDGLSAQLLGVPVLMDRIGIDLHGKVRKIKTRGVLSKAISVINVLSEVGWKTTALTGASGNYTQKESFFLSHGFQEVLCKEYWDARLTEVERRENQNKEWGYSDHFLYSELKRILNATQSDQPFAVLLETADTHPPIGSVSENARRFGDVRDAFLCASHQAA